MKKIYQQPQTEIHHVNIRTNICVASNLSRTAEGLGTGTMSIHGDDDVESDDVSLARSTSLWDE